MSTLKNHDVVDLSKSKYKPTIMEYVGKNCGALSFMIAIVVPIVSVYLTLMLYSYYHGYYSYFKVSDIWLDLSNKNNIYHLIFTLFVSFAIMALNVIPIILVKYKKGKGLMISTLIGIFMFGGLLFLSINKNFLVQALIIWLVMYGIGFIVSVSNYIVEKINDTRNKSSKSKISRSMEITIGLIIIAACLIADVVICFFAGKSIAGSKKEFKIIAYNGEYAVILNESKDNFVISEVDWDKDTNQLIIYANEQTVINNNNVTYKITDFTDVVVHK